VLIGCWEAVATLIGAVLDDMVGRYDLNNSPQYDLMEKFNTYFDEESNPYLNIDISSLFYDPHEFIEKFKNSQKSLILNFNIRSLQSNFDEMENFIYSILNAGVDIIAITLQEIWQISNINTVQLTGYTFFSLKGGGGGVAVSQYT